MLRCSGGDGSAMGSGEGGGGPFGGVGIGGGRHERHGSSMSFTSSSTITGG